MGSTYQMLGHGNEQACCMDFSLGDTLLLLDLL